MLASAGKMRLDAPDYVFVLGVRKGEFPAAPGQTSLLTHADRDALMRQQVDLPDCFGKPGGAGNRSAFTRP